MITIQPKTVHIFRSWYMSNYGYNNDVENTINEINEQGYTWELQVVGNWVYLMGVKQIIEDEKPSIEEKKEEQ